METPAFALVSGQEAEVRIFRYPLPMHVAATIPTVRGAEPQESNAVHDRPLLRVVIFGPASTGDGWISQLVHAAPWCSCRLIDGFDAPEGAFFQAIDAAVVVAADADRQEEARRERLMELLRRQRVGTLILSPQPWRFANYGFGTVSLPPDAPLDMVRGVLLALSRAGAVMLLVDKQVENLRRLSEMLSGQFEEMQNDLRLAARVQSEFLPRDLPQTGPLRFSTLFRPSGWVSGDIFDIIRLDERHWGFYVADVVGHGVAAGLLTVYIKHVIQPKRIHDGVHEVVDPAKVLSALNDHLSAQELRDSQFITGWYGLIDVQTLELRYAVAGHPPALLAGADGSVRELRGDGCILGLSPGQRFVTESVRLHTGDRLVVYTDGLEDALIAERPLQPKTPELAEGVAELLRAPAEELIARLGERLDAAPGSLSQADDASAIVVDISS